MCAVLVFISIRELDKLSLNWVTLLLLDTGLSIIKSIVEVPAWQVELDLSNTVTIRRRSLYYKIHCWGVCLTSKSPDGAGRPAHVKHEMMGWPGPANMSWKHSQFNLSFIQTTSDHSDAFMIETFWPECIIMSWVRSWNKSKMTGWVLYTFAIISASSLLFVKAAVSEFISFSWRSFKTNKLTR